MTTSNNAANNIQAAHATHRRLQSPGQGGAGSRTSFEQRPKTNCVAVGVNGLRNAYAPAQGKPPRRLLHHNGLIDRLCGEVEWFSNEDLRAEARKEISAATPG